jgi:tRNA uridine 5-carboxymethylaminomethyl modification enzyme
LLASERAETLARTRARLVAFRLLPSSATNAALTALGLAPIRQPIIAAELLRRPEVDASHLRALGVISEDHDPRTLATLLLDLKYEGYVARQETIVSQSARFEATQVPPGTDFASIAGLSSEAREKLSRVQPRTLGQAARIPGLTPAAISVLGVHLRRSRTA